MLAGISIAASEARKKTTRHESSRWMFILKKGIFRRFAFGTPNTTHTHMTAFFSSAW